MLWFLRLFPQYRTLEHSIDSWKREEKAWRESDSDYWRSQCEQKDAEIARLNALLIDEAHKIADTMSVHAIGKRVFSKASDQPPVEMRQVRQPQGAMFARAMQAKQTQATRQALAEMWEKLPAAEN